jgi:nucleoside-diphosphate-sugar epimerase
MKIILFGATGMIGGEIAKTCLAHGHEITAICRSNKSVEKARHLGCTALLGDITKPESYKNAFKSADVVIDAVGTGLPKRITRRRARAIGQFQLRMTRELVDACSAAKVEKLLLTVGSHLFAPADPNDWAVETNPPLFKGFAKTMTKIWPEYDKLCRKSRIVIRCHPGFVYGPGSWFRDQLVASIKKLGKPQMIGDGQNFCPYIYAVDIAEGYRLAAERAHPVDDYIFAAQPAKQIDFVNLASRLLGGKEIKSGLSTWLAKIIVGEVLVEAMTLSVRARSNKAKQELGWLPKYPTIEQGLPVAITRLKNE